MNKYNHFENSVSDIIKTEVNESNWKLIRKLHLPEKYNDPSEEEVKKGIVLD